MIESSILGEFSTWKPISMMRGGATERGEHCLVLASETTLVKLGGEDVEDYIDGE